MIFQKVIESVVPPKEGPEPKSSLGTLHARVHSREKIKSFFVFFFLFLPRVIRRERAERERERERWELFLVTHSVFGGQTEYLFPSGHRVFFPPFFFHASFSGGACGEREIERERERERHTHANFL